jgi:multiple antibiotic resistance protein
MSPLAFPTIVTPYGIATLVVLLALAPDRHGQLMIGAIMAAIMALNFLAMIATRYILPLLGVVLPIVGAVLGVIQVALGLLVIQNSLKAMGIG